MDEREVIRGDVLMRRPPLELFQQIERFRPASSRGVGSREKREVVRLPPPGGLRRLFHRGDRLRVASQELTRQAKRPGRVESIGVDVERAAELRRGFLHPARTEKSPGHVGLRVGRVRLEIRRTPGELERLLETVLERETEPEPGVSGGGPRR